MPTPSGFTQATLWQAQNNINLVTKMWQKINAGEIVGLFPEDQQDFLCQQNFTKVGENLYYHIPNKLIANWHKDTGGLICFTGGSSGGVKAILRSFASWQESFVIQQRLLETDPHARVLILGSLSHSLHLFGALEALSREVIPQIMPKFSARVFFNRCREFQPNIIYATPTLINLLIEFVQLTPEKTKKIIDNNNFVTHFICGGGVSTYIHKKFVTQFFPKAKWVEFFGSAETSYIAFSDGHTPQGSAGKICDEVSVHVTDENNNILANGITGKIWIKSPMLFTSYLFGENKSFLCKDEFISIGDYGWVDDHNYLFFVGRGNNVIKVADNLVYIEPIEALLTLIIKSKEVAVVAINDDKKGKALVVLTTHTQSIEIQQSAQIAIQKKFGKHLALRIWLVVPDWCYLSSGKTDRFALNKIAEEVNKY